MDEHFERLYDLQGQHELHELFFAEELVVEQMMKMKWVDPKLLVLDERDVVVAAVHY